MLDFIDRAHRFRVILGAIGILIGGLVVLLVVGDLVKGTRFAVPAVVVSKSHRAESTRVTSSGSTRRTKERWSVKVEGTGVSGSTKVTETLYRELNEGDKVIAKGTKGGITGWTYITGVEKAP